MMNQSLQEKEQKQQLAKSSVTVDTAVQSIVRLQNEGKLDMARAKSGRQLSYYKREDGIEQTGAVIFSVLISIANSYKLDKDKCYTELEAAEIAKAILAEFWYLKLAEIFLFAEKAKNGEFGKVYNRLDRATIFEWIREYDAQSGDFTFSEMQGRNETDDSPEVDEQTKRANRERADAALRELSAAFKPKETLRDKLTDHDFRKYALEYELTKPKPKPQADEIETK